MIRVQSFFGRTVAVTSVFSLVFAMLPGMALADAYQSVKNQLPKPKPPLASSKLLSNSKMKQVQGRDGVNPYAAGSSKWDVNYKGVNLMTGNFTTSGTDLTFEGGYGIPVNVTRSYSANNGEEGPLGKGWTLSVDVRSTAGGIMKSKGSAVKSVPVNFKERPSLQVDPNAVTADGSHVQPIQAVLATDSAGTEETIQRDADGILSTPPWDKNKIESEYETIVKPDGTNIQIMKKNWVNTPEGTVYVYEKMGYYDGGSRPYNQPNAAVEDSHVLKVTTATDRHGNVTTYTYSPDTPSGHVTFVKLNGTVKERKLTSIAMPNGHVINFTWTGNRITAATDGVRTVSYAYNANGMLTGVTTPGGKTTTYGYGSTAAVTNQSNQAGLVGDIMTSVTDPRGLSTMIASWCDLDTINPYGSMQVAVRTYKITAPNGNKTWFLKRKWNYSNDPRPTEYVPTGIWYHAMENCVWEENGNANPYQVMMTQGWWVDGNNVRYAAVASTAIHNSISGPPVATERTFDSADGNLLFERKTSYENFGDISQLYPNGIPQERLTKRSTEATYTYNFLGNQLSTTAVSKKYTTPAGWVTEQTSISETGYWGANKYYQQKAVKDLSTGRYSYTDYFDNTAPQGKKGQTYKVYDDARTDFTENQNIEIPVTVPAMPTTKYWKYRLEPLADTYSAKFDYDSKGRPIDVWKIQKITTNPWTYVRTNTTYGPDTGGIWGAATQVIEDFGGINRTTQTLAYDSIGRAIKVQDASGKQFLTNYDLDGVISSIQRVDGGAPQNIVTYTYGTGGVTNGAVLSVTDNLSGVSQAMSYYTNGAAIGQVQSITETNGADVYSSNYTYGQDGTRDTVTYVSQAALGQGSSTKWRYYNYISTGDIQSQATAFQALTRLDSTTNNATPEEFHYRFDTSGKTLEATFAMTPQTWTPSNGASYYDSAHKAQTRGRAYYEYDAGGRLKRLNHWWDTLAGSNYTSQFIRGNECEYETTGMNRGLKTTSKFLIPVSGQPLNWSVQRTETYSYDANLDYLIGANYGDGLPNANVTWGYDAAGNRTSDSSNPGTWIYDNLNRMTASPGFTYTNDVLGNRLTKGSATHTWDDLNRMLSYKVNNGSYPINYTYRADGLRVSKQQQLPGNQSSRTVYRYDGQMGVEDIELTSTNGGVSFSPTTLTRYGLGARGIDVVSTTTSSGNTVSYPLYDAHGNNVGALNKNGSSFSVSNEKSYDAWGGLRSGNTSGGKATYCANLGHKQDDESGLVYMRARYYEPTSGRFISEDGKGDGSNWYVYCWNNPLNAWDMDGGIAIFALMAIALEIIAAAELIINFFWHPNDPGSKAFQALTTAMAAAIVSSVTIAAAVRSDAKYAGAATAIASMVLAVSIFVIAHQSVLLMMLNSIDDDSDLDKWELFQKQAGQPEGCFGL